MRHFFGKHIMAALLAAGLLTGPAGMMPARADTAETYLSAGEAYDPGEGISAGQRDIVRRARQLMELRWTPLSDRYQWGGEAVFTAGTEYIGVPYGQPVETGYIGYALGPGDFLEAVRDADSEFYTGHSQYNRVAPFYSCDCSGFISYAWGLPQRHTTGMLPDIAEQPEPVGTETLQVGDCLDLAGVHAVLVSAVRRDAGGRITSVDIMEQTPPICRYTRYGEGGSRALRELEERYFEKGYVILRYPERDAVRYEHDCAVPIDGDHCALCLPPAAASPAPGDGLPFADVPADAWFYAAVSEGYHGGLFQGTSATLFSPAETMTRGMFVTILGRLAGVSEELLGAAAGPGPFSDLDEGKYYAPYVKWAALAGIIAAEDGQFRAEEAIRREDMCRMLWGYARAYGLAVPPVDGEAAFSDSAEISPDARRAVMLMAETGVVNGTGDGSFEAGASATRAQVAQICMRFRAVWMR